LPVLKYYKRYINNNLCPQCGDKRNTGVYCFKCSILNNDRVKEIFKRYREKGLCRCGQPLEGLRLLCNKCSKKYAEESSLRRNRYKQEGRCTVCGRNLHPEMDENCVQCLNCRCRLDTFGTWKNERRAAHVDQKTGNF